MLYATMHINLLGITTHNKNNRSLNENMKYILKYPYQYDILASSITYDSKSISKRWPNFLSNTSRMYISLFTNISEFMIQNTRTDLITTSNGL